MIADNYPTADHFAHHEYVNTHAHAETACSHAQHDRDYFLNLILAGFKSTHCPVHSNPEEISLELATQLEHSNKVSATGNDSSLRMEFVSLQGYAELAITALLTNNDKNSLIALFHTPSPSSPLCVKPGKSTYPSDSVKHLTIGFRSHTTRELLNKGASFINFYTTEGKDKRTQEELDTYSELVNQHNVKEYILNSLPEGFSGATYFIKLENNTLLFSIKALQSNYASDESSWEIILSAIDSEEAQEHLKEILPFLLENTNAPEVKALIDAYLG